LAVARLDRLVGAARLLDGSEVREGHDLPDGGGLETSGAASLAALRTPDGTRLELRGQARVDRILLRPGGGKSVFLGAGQFSFDAPRQPPGRPLTVVTPQADVTVLGTRFLLHVTADATRLEVTEGRVRITRREDGASVEVGADHFAVVTKGLALAPRLLPVDEVLLLPRDGRIAGQDWRQARDETLPGGLALEVPRRINRDFPAPKTAANPLRQIPSAVLFTFRAEAGKDYHVWIRGACTAAADRSGCDSVVLEPADGSFVRPCPWFGPAGHNAFLFDHFSDRDGYWWVGGNPGPGAPAGGAFAVLRFARSGDQKLALYVLESPLRVAAIWLSATQKDRPDSALPGPASLIGK
jgi:hypothetical protein